MIEVKGYVCSHCKAHGRVNRVYSTKTGAARHEKHCYFDPARKTCAMCDKCHQEEQDDNGSYGDTGTFWGRGNHCVDGYDSSDSTTSDYPVTPQHDCAYWVEKKYREHV